MTAGAVVVPTIVPLRAPYPGQHKTSVDTSTKIELRSETEGVKIYYTLNGHKPEPFQTIGPATRATHLYREPFRLAAGKRTIKAVAVSKDGRESFVVTKVFDVEQLESDVVVDDGDDLEFMAEIPIIQQAKREVQKFADKMVTGREAWAEIQRMKTTSGSSTANGAGKKDAFSLRNGKGTLHDAPSQNDRVMDGDLSSKIRQWTADGAFTSAADKYQSFSIKCPKCHAPKPLSPTAKFCDNCGSIMPSMPQYAVVNAVVNKELGPCWNCKSVVPLSLRNCAVCEVSFIQGGPSLFTAPSSTMVITDHVLCTICGTSNSSTRTTDCVTCGASLRTFGKIVRQDLGNSPQTQMVTLKCMQCGNLNSINAVSCSRCNAKSLSTNVICSTCTASNNTDSQFCGTCGLALIVPPGILDRNDTGSRHNGNGSHHKGYAPHVTGNPSNVHQLMASRNPAKCDAITQTVGLVYQSQSDKVQKNGATGTKDAPDHKPLLSTVSPGKGYWRKQMEHICGHLKAHAAVTPDFRSAVSVPQLGKVLFASVKDDGDEFSVRITFKRHDNDKVMRRQRRIARSDSDDDGPAVEELRGVSHQLLRTYGSGRKSSCSSHDGFDSDTDRSTKTRRKASGKYLPSKSSKTSIKKSEIDFIKKEDQKLLKEVGKNGAGEPPEIRQLVEEGANPNCVNKDGVPALHVAVKNKHLDAIRALVDEGAKVDAKEKIRGYTALHEAILLGSSGGKLIDVLLECGADINVKNNKGETPYDMAVREKLDVIVKKFASFLGQSKLDRLTKPRPARGVNIF